MERSNRGARGGSSRGGRREGGSRDSGRREGGSRDFRSSYSNKRSSYNDGPEMFDTVCSDCGEDCQVPFKPRGNKPVLCSSCFRGNDGGRDERPRREDRNSRGRREEKRMYDAVCCECGRDFELPFRPSGDRAVYCEGCFDGGKKELNHSSHSEEDLTEYFEEKFANLEAKLDAVVRLLAEKGEKASKKPKKDLEEKTEKKAKAVGKEKDEKKAKTVAKKKTTKKD